MIKKAFLIVFPVLLLALPFTAWAANIPAKVYESGSNNMPVAVSGVKVEVFGGYGFKALLSSTESGGDGGCLLRNLPLGKEVLLRLTKSGYVSQYELRSFPDNDSAQDVILWIGSDVNVKGLYSNLGETFDSKKGHVYLEINDENTGEGVSGIQLGASSGTVYDLGQGEYLIANAEGASLQIGIQKPGYAFDIESATIPLFPGCMTQYYIKVQSGGAIFASAQAGGATSACITGYVRRLTDAVGLSCVSIAFTRHRETWGPSVHTDSTGFYKQCGFPVCKRVRVTPSKAPWKFRPSYKIVHPRDEKGAIADFIAY